MNWFLMLLAFLLGALVTWLWSVRSATRMIPASEYDRMLDADLEADADVDRDVDADRDVEVVEADTVEVVEHDRDADLRDGAVAAGAAGAAGAAAGRKKRTKERNRKNDRAALAAEPDELRDEDEVFDAQADEDRAVAPQAGDETVGAHALGDGDDEVFDGDQDDTRTVELLDADDDVVDPQSTTVASDHTQAIPVPLSDEDDSDLPDADGASVAGYDVEDEYADQEYVDGEWDDAPYGPGSARADAEGNGPEGWFVKGNADSGLFHTEDSPGYANTTAEVWFQDEESAVAAGFRHWDRKRR